MRQIRHYAIAAAIGLFALVQSASSAELPGRLKFQNELNESITVDILHSNGERQKGTTIAAGKSHTFTFNSASEKCRDKSRGFEITRTSAGAMVASGTVTFKSDVEYSSRSESCTMQVQTPEISLALPALFQAAYKKLKVNRGQITVKRSLGSSVLR